MYSLIAIFAFIPLYFSHIFAPFGLIIGETSSFERQKVLLFLLLVVGVFLELLWSHYDEMVRHFSAKWKQLLFFVLFPVVSYRFFGASFDVSFFLGSHEKYHGYLFFVALVFLGFFLQVLSSSEKKLLIRASLFGGVFVSFFALLESIGVSVFFEIQNDAVWGSGRSISTLGNPNYVAGYLLILLPLVSTLQSTERQVIATLFVMAILSTKSYIAIYLLLLYGAFLLFNRLKKIGSIPVGKIEYLPFILTIFVAIVGVFLGDSMLSGEKLLSLTSRFVLMRETLGIMIQYPLSFLFGFGPDSIVRAYDFVRSAVIDNYFPKGSAIDSSHNIVVDMLFQFGTVFLIYAIYAMYHIWKKLPKMSKEGFILGLAFLSLNPYILAHCIMLVFLTSLHVSNS